MEKRGQIWSLEVIISLSFFLVVFVGIAALVTVSNQEQINTIERDAQYLAELFIAKETTIGQDFAFVQNNQFDQEKFDLLKGMITYKSFKERTQFEKDFCIIVIDGDTEQYFGSSDITVGGTPCA